MLLALMLSALAAAPVAAKAPPQRVASTVRISLNNDGYFETGDRVTARITSSDDGYLVVFRATTRGRVRVLYPLDPGLDNFVRGGKTYEVLGRGGKESFRVDDEEGSGVLYAAVAEDPLQLDQFVRGDHWDYRAFADYQVSDDAEATFADLMDKMTAGGRYQFDLASYHVGRRDYGYDRGYSHPYYSGWYTPCFGCGPYYGSGFSISIGFGRPFYRPFYPFYPYYYAGFYDPFYDPWFYDPFFYRPVVYRAPYYATCYVAPCRGYNTVPYYSGRPRYGFKPGFQGTPVDYRPRFRGGSPAPGIGVTPRDRRDPLDGPGSGTRVRPVSRDEGPVGSSDGPRHRIGVEDRSTRPGGSGQDGYRPRPRTDDPAPRGDPSTGDRPPQRAEPRSGEPSTGQDAPRRAEPRRAEPSQGQDAPRRAEGQSRRDAPPSSHPQPRSGGQSGGSARPSGGGSPRRRT